MGCWSTYCAVSNHYISGGEKIVLIPIVKTHIGVDINYYNPICPPIYGEYNHYGSIENIVESPLTKLIEKVYKKTIEEFCHILTRYHHNDISKTEIKNDKDKYKIENIDYCFISLDVWNIFTEKSYNNYGSQLSSLKNNKEKCLKEYYLDVYNTSLSMFSHKYDDIKLDMVESFKDEIPSLATMYDKKGINYIKKNYSKLQIEIANLRIDDYFYNEFIKYLYLFENMRVNTKTLTPTTYPYIKISQYMSLMDEYVYSLKMNQILKSKLKEGWTEKEINEVTENNIIL